MKKLFFVFVLSLVAIAPLEAQWCGCPCLRNRYYNPGWVDDDSRFYGYVDINDYPYALPVNRYFNPRPCKASDFPGYYRYQPHSCPPPPCPRCNGSHR